MMLVDQIPQIGEFDQRSRCWLLFRL